VFRALASQPVGVADYLLAAAQGVVNCLAFYQTQGAGANSSVEAILGKAFLFGPIAGVISLFLMAAIYRRLGARAGGKAARDQVVHVLAYGGVPMLASLAVWVLTALLVGETTFVQTPRPDVEGFVVLLLQVQFTSYVLCLLWSVVLQVMGFSEILGLLTRKAFGMWVLGQIIGFLATLLIAILIATLFPGIVPH
jgi:hypothetical protein